MNNSFMEVHKCYKDDGIKVRPIFIFRKSEELVIKNGQFYAMWDNDEGCWVKDILEAAEMIDNRVLKFVDEYCLGEDVIVDLCKYYDSGVFESFAKYCRLLPDNYYEVYCPIN